MSVEFAENLNLADYFLYRRLEEGAGEKTAILYGDHSYSYQAVADRSSYLANYLQSIGLEKEQRVHIVLPDTPPFAWSIFAIWTAGGVLTMGNPESSPEDLLYVMAYTGTTVLITLPDIAQSIVPFLENSPVCKSLKAVLLVPDTRTGEDTEKPCSIPSEVQQLPVVTNTVTAAIEQGKYLDVLKNSHYTTRPEVHRDDLACWLFTSGSTGKPKAAMHTHRDFAFNTELYAKKTVGYQGSDITVSVPRLFFGYATGTNLFFPFAVGATTALFSEQPNPQTLSEAIQRYHPTIITNVPAMLGKLLIESPELDFSSVRFQLSAGEALPPTLLNQFLAHFKTDIYDGIGSAEMFHIYCTNRPDDIKPGSLGRVVEGYELKILPADAEGAGAQEVMPGETGVLWVKGDSVALGYHRDREKSWKTFHGKWCRTGDLFSKDEQGYLWFQGRADDLFKVNGRWMAPQEVEDCLLQHEDVATCVVVPIEIDGLLKPKAFIVLKQGNPDTEKIKELQGHVLARLAKHKYPRQIEFIGDIPKNDRGKIDRRQLIRQG